MLVFVALPLLFPTPRTPGCECPLNVTPLAFGPPSEGSAGPNHWYNFTVQSAGGGIVLENIGLAIETATGTDVVPGASWTALLLGLGGELVGTYSFVTASWTGGATAAISSGQVLVVDIGATNLAGVGDALNVFGTGGFQGSISIGIP